MSQVFPLKFLREVKKEGRKNMQRVSVSNIHQRILRKKIPPNNNQQKRQQQRENTYEKPIQQCNKLRILDRKQNRSRIKTLDLNSIGRFIGQTRLNIKHENILSFENKSRINLNNLKVKCLVPSLCEEKLGIKCVSFAEQHRKSIHTRRWSRLGPQKIPTLKQSKSNKKQDKLRLQSQHKRQPYQIAKTGFHGNLFNIKIQTIPPQYLCSEHLRKDQQTIDDRQY